MTDCLPAGTVYGVEYLKYADGAFSIDFYKYVSDIQILFCCRPYCSFYNLTGYTHNCTFQNSLNFVVMMGTNWPGWELMPLIRKWGQLTEAGISMPVWLLL